MMVESSWCASRFPLYLSQPFYMFDIFHHKELENINSVSMLMKMIFIKTKTSNHYMAKNILATKVHVEKPPIPSAWKLGFPSVIPLVKEKKKPKWKPTLSAADPSLTFNTTIDHK